jgi:hypothetical protein
MITPFFFFCHYRMNRSADAMHAEKICIHLRHRLLRAGLFHGPGDPISRTVDYCIQPALLFMDLLYAVTY